jgi:DNA-binding response OmpR family regulator
MTTESLDGLRILLAEDDPMILFALEATVESFGCTVAGTAMQVGDALAIIATNTVDVAIVDVTLADGNCDPLVAALVAKGIPIVLASGASSSAHAKGPNGAIFLQKPFSDRDLHKALLVAGGRAKERRNASRDRIDP